MAIDPSEIMAVALSDWGETVIVGGESITGLWQEPFAGASPLDGRVEMTAPALLVQVADLPAGPIHGTAVVRGGITYYVRGIEPDGLGATLLILSED